MATTSEADTANRSDINERFLSSLLAADDAQVRVCLALGADVNAVFHTRHDATPLHLAAVHSSSGCLVELLQRNPQCASDALGDTPLHVAALRSSRMSNIVLLANSFGVSLERNQCGNTILHQLMANKSLSERSLFDTVEWFSSQSGFYPLLNIINNSHSTMLDLAMKHHRANHAMLDLLIRAGAVRAAVIYYERMLSLEVEEQEKRNHLLTESKEQLEELTLSFGAFLSALGDRNAAVAEKERSKRAHLEKKEQSSYRKLKRKARMLSQPGIKSKTSPSAGLSEPKGGNETEMTVTERPQLSPRCEDAAVVGDGMNAAGVDTRADPRPTAPSAADVEVGSKRGDSSDASDTHRGAGGQLLPGQDSVNCGVEGSGLPLAMTALKTMSEEERDELLSMQQVGTGESGASDGRPLTPENFCFPTSALAQFVDASAEHNVTTMSEDQRRRVGPVVPSSFSEATKNETRKEDAVACQHFSSSPQRSSSLLDISDKGVGSRGYAVPPRAARPPAQREGHGDAAVLKLPAVTATSAYDENPLHTVRTSAPPQQPRAAGQTDGATVTSAPRVRILDAEYDVEKHRHALKTPPRSPGAPLLAAPPMKAAAGGGFYTDPEAATAATRKGVGRTRPRRATFSSEYAATEGASDDEAVRRAATTLRQELVRFYESECRSAWLFDAAQRKHETSIQGTMYAVTQLVWRENFCCALKDVLFLARRRDRGAEGGRRETWFSRSQKLAHRIERYVILLQIVISMFLLIYMGCAPRTSANTYHNYVDMAFSIVELIIAFFLPLSLWRLFDFAIPIVALCCSATQTYAGTVVITLFTLKIPFLVHHFTLTHSGTRTYCRCIRYTGFYLIVFSPLLVASVGASVRGSSVSDLLLSSRGNWASVFLYLWSTVSPQYQASILIGYNQSVATTTSPLFYMHTDIQLNVLDDNRVLIHLNAPIVQLIVCNVALIFYTWSAVLVGTHGAIRRHFDISDQTKLKANKHFRRESHRAASMEALGQQVDGVVWETDVRAAKEAIDASHYDHNAKAVVHRFIKNVRDTVMQNVNLEEKMTRQKAGKNRRVNTGDARWDCRNEDPQSRGSYDIEVIETALGAVTRKGRLERFVERQWTGPIQRRETTLIIIVMTIMAAIKPNLYVMEALFSAVFAVELLGSLYALRLAFIFKHYVRLLVRLACILFGFISAANPYVVLRVLRLLEGWSHIYAVPGMLRWSALYMTVTFVTLWMISYVAALQHLASRPDDSGCRSAANCLAISLREMVLPAWTEMHIDTVKYAPVMCMLTIVFQLIFIPLVLTLVLHPLLQLSNFIGRFLRLVLQRLHYDVLDFLGSYLEGETFYRHWRMHLCVSPNIITKLKMMYYDRYFMQGARTTYVKNIEYQEEGQQEGQPVYNVGEIVSIGDFASFEENLNSGGASRGRTVIMQFNRYRRSIWLHWANLILTVISFGFLWGANVTAPAASVVNILASVFHVVSIIANFIVVPSDFTAVLTVVSAFSLVTSVVMMSLTGFKYREYYCIRFISLIRCCQFQFYPFRGFRRFIRTYIDSGIKVIFPFLVVGGLSYAAELLRAQIYMVRTNPLVGVNMSNATEVQWTLGNLTYPEYLAAYPHTKSSYQNTRETNLLFVHFFTQDSYIFFSIFEFWLLPALCICTCLAYLFWSGANMRDTQRLLISAITSLEDPLTMAGYVTRRKAASGIGNSVLIISVVFGCIFSPTTVSTRDDFTLFFAFEIVFLVIGLLESFFTLFFAARRLRRTLVPHVSRNASVAVGDGFLFVCELLHLLYYAVALPLSASLLREKTKCIISPESYAVYFVTLRFLFLLRILPRPYLLSISTNSILILVAGSALVIYFVTSASALADLWAAEKRVQYPQWVWRAALEDLLRQTFTSAIPSSFAVRWAPSLAALIQSGNTPEHAFVNVSSTEPVINYISTNYTSSRVLFILSIIGRALISSTIGLGIAVVLVPFHTTVLTQLPPKTKLLYESMCGGASAILELGMRLHDDMRPEARRRAQKRKLARMFTVKGIPFWALPHLLEELNICRPAKQRRFMFALEKLLEYFPISEDRMSKVASYVEAWDCYRCGGPDQLRFKKLPVFPTTDSGFVRSSSSSNTQSTNPLEGALSSVQTFSQRSYDERYVSPLRLVQALALFELDFPSESSVGSKLWTDFFTVVQKLRGATMFQSLWRMYVAERQFDRERSVCERYAIVALRRSFRKMKVFSNVKFRSFSTFSEALVYEREVFNLNSSHYDVLDRLRGHYDKLKPTALFAIVSKRQKKNDGRSDSKAFRRESTRMLFNISMRSPTASNQIVTDAFRAQKRFSAISS